MVQKGWRELENEWLGRQKTVEAEANALGTKGAESVREYLTRYTADQARKAWTTAKLMAGKLGEMKTEK
jgi:hypothetical protein